MKRLLIVTNQPAPYRVDFFIYLQEHYGEQYDIWVLFSTGNNASVREWKADENRLKNKVYLNSKVIKIRSSYDTNEKIISYGVRKKLREISPDIVVASEYNFTVLAVKHWCNIHNIPYILNFTLFQNCGAVLADGGIESANTVGYQNQMHFSRAFKTIYGCSPSEYRSKSK